MEPKREQAFVGLFVLVAVAILIGTVILLSGAFATSPVRYKTYFAFAGGLESGSAVRYAGGPKIGQTRRLAPRSCTPRLDQVGAQRPGRSRK